MDGGGSGDEGGVEERSRITPGVLTGWIVEPFTEMWNTGGHGGRREEEKSKAKGRMSPFARDSNVTYLVHATYIVYIF